MSITVPKKLNGYPVVMSWAGVNLAVVVCRIDHVTEFPYVVAQWWPTLRRTWSNGQYHESAIKAAEDFLDLATKLKRLDPPFQVDSEAPGSANLFNHVKQR